MTKRTSLSLGLSALGVALAFHGACAQGQSLAELLKAVQSGQADKTPPLKLPEWPPWPANAVAPVIHPLKGLTFVGAITDPRGDYEGILVIEQMTPTYTLNAYSANVPAPGGSAPASPSPSGKVAEPATKNVECLLQIDEIDRHKSHIQQSYVCKNNHGHEHYPGNDAPSLEMLEQLRAGQDSDFYFTPFESWMGALTGMMAGLDHTGGASGEPTLMNYQGKSVYFCKLHRVGTTDVAFPVLLNDRPTQLPALRARCTFGDGERVELFILDVPGSPSYKLAEVSDPIGARAQIVKIWMPPEPPPQASGGLPTPHSAGGGGGAGDLNQVCSARVVVALYGIYFDFNSATIRPQSEPELKQIADLLRANPACKLKLSGHTDSIGEAAFNLDLSQRRAAAVKTALETQHKIGADRLTTDGYGATRPVAPNDTMEGRARNRRVELQQP